MENENTVIIAGLHSMEAGKVRRSGKNPLSSVLRVVTSCVLKSNATVSSSSTQESKTVLSEWTSYLDENGPVNDEIGLIFK